MRHVRVYESLVIKGGAAASQYFNANSAEILRELRQAQIAKLAAGDDAEPDEDPDDDPDDDDCPECSGSGKCKACSGTGSKTDNEEEKND